MYHFCCISDACCSLVFFLRVFFARVQCIGEIASIVRGFCFPCVLSCDGHVARQWVNGAAFKPRCACLVNSIFDAPTDLGKLLARDKLCL